MNKAAIKNFHLLSGEEELEIKKLVNKIKQDSDTFGLFRFGSSVSSTKYNDIDLAIISIKEISTKNQYKYRVFLPEKFDVRFFHNLPIYIQASVLENAVYEYIGDYDRIFDICFKSIKEFSLFKPHYEAYLELVENY